MRVKTIVPCVCTANKPNKENSTSYGMPLLAVECGFNEGEQFYSAFCPKCGRGSRLADFSSSYLALKHWNKMQKGLWLTMEMMDRGLFE